MARQGGDTKATPLPHGEEPFCSHSVGTSPGAAHLENGCCQPTALKSGDSLSALDVALVRLFAYGKQSEGDT